MRSSSRDIGSRVLAVLHVVRASARLSLAAAGAAGRVNMECHVCAQDDQPLFAGRLPFREHAALRGDMQVAAKNVAWASFLING